MHSSKLRYQINNILRTDSDLQAFCLDYFPVVYKRFTDNMDRQQKINLLLTLEDKAEISKALDVSKSEFGSNEKPTKWRITTPPILVMVFILIVTIAWKIEWLKNIITFVVQKNSSTLDAVSVRHGNLTPDLGASKNLIMHIPINNKDGLIIHPSKRKPAEKEVSNAQDVRPKPHSHM